MSEINEQVRTIRRRRDKKKRSRDGWVVGVSGREGEAEEEERAIMERKINCPLQVIGCCTATEAAAVAAWGGRCRSRAESRSCRSLLIPEAPPAAQTGRKHRISLLIRKEAGGRGGGGHKCGDCAHFRITFCGRRRRLLPLGKSGSGRFPNIWKAAAGQIL